MRSWRIPLWLELSAAVLLALIASNAVTFAIAEYQRAAEIKAERLNAMQDRLGALRHRVIVTPRRAGDLRGPDRRRALS